MGKLFVPYSLQTRFVNSGQILAGNAALMLIGEQRRGTWRCRPPGLFLWMIIPEAAEQIMKDLAGKDLKRGRCRFTCESWCEAGSSVQGVFEMG